MNRNKIQEHLPVNTPQVIFFMVLVFIIVQIGFHATYIRHFPEFNNFGWLHHIHGALMASWVMLLVLQPLLIHKGRYAAHHFFGKLSYIIAPLIIISMFLIAKLHYHKWVAQLTHEGVFAIQSITWMQLLLFVVFYTMAVYQRKNTAAHMRFMIGTAILMTGPALGRIINAYFIQDLPALSGVLIPLYFKTALAAAFLLSDIIKKKNPVPYTIVFLAFLLADLVYYARHSDLWQAFGRFVADNLY